MNNCGKYWFDPIKCLQMWLWLGLNIVCLTIVVKLGKLLLHVVS